MPENGNHEPEEGLSIADFVDEGDTLTDPGPPPIAGGQQQLSLLAGGEEPSSASMKMRGGSIPVEGEFEKGDSMTLLVVCRVAEVHFVDTVDEYGTVITTERRHVAKVMSVRRLDEEDDE